LQTLPANMDEQKEGEMSGISNFSDMVFQLWPKLNYEAHKVYEKLEKEKKIKIRALKEYD